MNTGKQICEILKSIRKDIATTYGLKYEPTECGFTGDCPGSCKYCDAEIKDLERQFYEKYHDLAPMIYYDFSQEVNYRCFDLLDKIKRSEQSEQLMGGIRPYGEIEENEKKIRKRVYKNNLIMEDEILNDLKKKLKQENFANCTKEEDYQKAFEEIADILLHKIAIRKGDKEYWIKEVEFYLYNNNHRDIITYPRVCEAGQWFFHSSGVDISFESYVKTEQDEQGLFRPVIDEKAFFGGILIRSIYPANNSSEVSKKFKLDGPYKVEWTLFDQFDAFNEVKDFPHLISRQETSHDLKSDKRRNLLTKGKSEEQKVHDILKYNYKESEIPDDELVKSFKDYLEKQYNLTV